MPLRLAGILRLNHAGAPPIDTLIGHQLVWSVITHMPKYYAVLARRNSVKDVKIILERDGLLNKRIKIKTTPTSSNHVEAGLTIPTNVPVSPKIGVEQCPEGLSGSQKLKAALLRLRNNHGREFNLTEVDGDDTGGTRTPLQASIAKALEVSIPDLSSVVTQCLQDLLEAHSGSYCLWNPMLLLPEHTFTAPNWRQILTSLQANPSAQATFFSTLAEAMNVTHIAINAPIPTFNPTTDTPSTASENLLRSPTNLQPLHGDFGPELPPFPSHLPSHTDFHTAFWVSTRQNGILQTWAPRYTMFSAGNVTEKARLLTLPSVRAAAASGQQDGRGCAAVDLFSGIGYFAFSYVRADVSKVLCWDLNPWSIEGLRRGAARNKWKTFTVVDEGVDTAASTNAKLGESEFDDARLLLFCQSNAAAGAHIARFRGRVPPIRHVNCGMLPSVGEAWKTAVDALDPGMGGWLHLHETVSERNLGARAEEIVGHVRGYLEARGDAEAGEGVRLEFVEKVKSVGPRMLHVVLDVWVPPRR